MEDGNCSRKESNHDKQCYIRTTTFFYTIVCYACSNIEFTHCLRHVSSASQFRGACYCSNSSYNTQQYPLLVAFHRTPSACQHRARNTGWHSEQHQCTGSDVVVHGTILFSDTADSRHFPPVGGCNRFHVHNMCLTIGMGFLCDWRDCWWIACTALGAQYFSQDEY